MVAVWNLKPTFSNTCNSVQSWNFIYKFTQFGMESVSIWVWEGVLSSESRALFWGGKGNSKILQVSNFFSSLIHPKSPKIFHFGGMGGEGEIESKNVPKIDELEIRNSVGNVNFSHFFLWGNFPFLLGSVSILFHYLLMYLQDRANVSKL